ncbi:hypothetical protein HDZ31DRAFT_62165 [Schizophyllum fasciatum]
MASPFVPPLDSTPGSSPQHTPLPPVIPGPPGDPRAGAAPPWAHTPHTPAAYPAAAPPMYPPQYPPYGYGAPPPATPYMGGYGAPPPGPPPGRGGWGAGWGPPPPEPPRTAGGWSADPGPHRPPGVSEDYVGYPPQSFTSPWAAAPQLPGGWGAPPGPPPGPPPHAGPYGYRAQPMGSAYTPYGPGWGASPAAAPYPPYGHDPYGGPPPGTPWAGGPPANLAPPPMPPAPGPSLPRGHAGDRVGKFASGPHYGPVLTPLLLKVTNAALELNPILMPPPDDPNERQHLRWNMTFPTSHCQRSDDNPNASWMRGRNEPATFPRLTELRLVPDKTPWPLTVRAADPALGVTAGEVIEALKEDMYRFTARADYEALARAERHAVGRAYAANRAPAPGVVGGALGEGMRRFDFLGAHRMFGGLEVDAGGARTAGLPAVFVLRCAQPLRQEIEAHEAVSRRIEEEARERQERLEREERLERIRASRAAESHAGSHAGSTRAGSRAGESRAGSRATLSVSGSRAGSRAHSRTSSRRLASVTSTSDEDSSSD